MIRRIRGRMPFVAALAIYQILLSINDHINMISSPEIYSYNYYLRDYSQNLLLTHATDGNSLT
jgi:hypothetical protein